MNSQDVVRPVRSLQEFRLRESGVSVGRIRPADLLRAVLRAGDGENLRCATNVVVYGDQSPAAGEFVAEALACLGPLDSLWRVGGGRATDPRVVWVNEDERLLTMLTARALFIPGDERHEWASAEWQDRADAVFVGPGSQAEAVESFFSAFSQNVWRWGAQAVVIEPHVSTPKPAVFVDRGVSIPLFIAHARVDGMEAEEAYSEFRFECWSNDSRVRATVQGGRGGDLTLLFAATDPQLNGAEIRFTFRTSAGGVLAGRTQLWTDQGDPTLLAAFWQGNQMDLARSARPEGEAAQKVTQMTFVFEVLAPPPASDNE